MRRLRQLILGSRPSPLELVVGPDQYGREFFIGGALIIGLTCSTVLVALGLLILPGPDIPGLRPLGIVAIVGAAMIVWTVVLVFGRNWSPERMMWMVLPFAPGVATAIWFAGPRVQVSAAVIPIFVATAIVYQRRRVAVIMAVLFLASYALVLALADGYPRPAALWTLVAGVTIAGGALLEFLFRHLRTLVDRERATAAELQRAHAQLADAHALLESRVTDQVGEIERLGQLRRFLTPQIAESVLSGDADSLLATHRRRIAVFFCDLRGFTRFSSSAEPEDIAEVLNEYYEVLGRAIEEHRATVGGFAGDGIWAFFNDPFPVEDPAGQAFAMALSLREPLRSMRRAWEARGFVLGYGLGIAYGYATMSTIGFESRSEYTAVGSVVNLGARLCDAAADGELLIDARAYNEIKQDMAGEPTRLELKGFGDPITAYRVAL